MLVLLTSTRRPRCCLRAIRCGLCTQPRPPPTEFDSEGLKLRIYQNLELSMTTHARYAATVWPCSVVLATFIAQQALLRCRLPAYDMREFHAVMKGMRVLELGAGCGLASQTCAALGATVNSTDRSSR